MNAPATNAQAGRFACSICEEPSLHICCWCTKDACDNHLCARCNRCSDCCECDQSRERATAE